MLIEIKRINYNKFIVGDEEFNFLQLVHWFKEIVTE